MLPLFGINLSRLLILYFVQILMDTIARLSKHSISKAYNMTYTESYLLLKKKSSYQYKSYLNLNELWHKVTSICTVYILYHFYFTWN